MSASQREDFPETGFAAVLGHQMLHSVSVVVGALETLRRDGTALSASNRELLEAAIERNLAQITVAAHTLVHGDHYGL